MIDLIYKNESFKVIGACMEVHKELGPGFLEEVYHEALRTEFENQNIPYEIEKELSITFKGKLLNKKYNADFVCFDKMILEIKAAKELTVNQEAQVINYLKATGFKLGLLVNFGESRLKYKRLIRSDKEK